MFCKYEKTSFYYWIPVILMNLIAFRAHFVQTRQFANNQTLEFLYLMVFFLQSGQR